MGGGDYTWDLVSPVSASARIDGLAESLRALISEHDEVALDPIAGGLRAPGASFAQRAEGERSPSGVAGVIKRTLLLRVVPGAAPAAVAEFERVLLAMPEHIGAIHNWCLSRVRGASPRGWTHVWEQDFADLAGLSDDYMNHPIHWSVVDGWFHAEDPRCIVAPRIAHVFCRSPRSLLSHALAPVSER